jgi:hypothetical protein
LSHHSMQFSSSTATNVAAINSHRQTPMHTFDCY